MEKYLAHISTDGREQTVIEHLIGTAELSSKFADDFDASDYAYITGLLHDIGKYSAEFQKRLHGGHKVDHSTAGAVEAAKNRQTPAAFCIAGHHSGLPDGGSRTDAAGSTLFGRLNNAKKSVLPDYSAWKEEVTLKHNPMLPAMKDPAEASFYIRMLYSCLVDADFLDTEKFMVGTARTQIPFDAEKLNKLLDDYISPWLLPRGELNEKRCAILTECIRKGDNSDRGLYTLTAPTGGGKTVASLAFALRHAKRCGMQRVIYVIPYTSIIEQTAETFRDILGAENVLEHHSGVLFEVDENEDETALSKATATENWDMPVVVTTAVQFFESLFASKPSKCRKLHNLANSVIIFDETQMIPVPYLKPCVYAIAQLVKNYKATAVLCTATQPALGKLLEEFIPGVTPQELCPDELFRDEIFKRVTFEKAGKLSNVEIADLMNNEKQVLCIVNSRKSARELYETLDKEGSYHLSTLMYPAHRRAVLKEIREKLAHGEECRVAATSLIEAGVDVDFPAVFREEAGLDSILQAAGRCNREGKRSAAESVVTVFASENKIPPVFEIPVKAGRISIKDTLDFSTKETIERYFGELFSLKGTGELDKKDIIKRLRNDNFPFKTVSELFKLIDTDTRTIYIPTEEAENLLSRLCYGGRSRALYRELGQYGVSVYENHYKALESAGAVQILDDGSAVLTDMTLYSPETGLKFDADSGQALFI